MNVGRWLAWTRDKRDQAALAEEALARERTRGEREQRLYHLGILALLLQSAGSMQEMLEAFLERGADIGGARFVYPLFLDNRRQVLTAQAMQGLPSARLDQMMDAFQEDMTAIDFPLVGTPLEALLDRGELVIEAPGFLFQGVLDDEQWQAGVRQLGVAKVALAPMVMEGEPLGIVCFGFGDDEVDVEIVELLAAHFTLSSRDLKLEEQAARYSDIDPVTWVYNRRYLGDTLERETLRAARYHRAVSLIVLDIDNFGAFNTGFGQSMGDRLLRLAATTMASMVAPPEIVARIKDDEFAVVLPETDRVAAVEVARALLGALAQVSPFGGDAEEPVTACAAIACFPEDGANARQLLDRALADLEEAKRERKASVRPGRKVIDPAEFLAGRARRPA
jgi:diguanylate cyclase (GGDEF)-like protein